MIKAKVIAKTNININDYIKLQGFGKGGGVQKVIDSEVIRLSDHFAPSDTTALRKSAVTETLIGSGEVEYSVYGDENGRNTWNDTTSEFQDRPVRGPFWVKRAMEAGGWEKLQLAIANWFKKKG